MNNIGNYYMMENKTIIRTVDACEKMSQVETICTDITGMVTEDVLNMEFIWNMDSVYLYL